MNIQILKDELTNDPQQLGYAPHIASGAYSIVCDLINNKTLNGSINVKSISRNDLTKSVIASDFSTLTATQQTLWDILLRSDNIEISNTNIKGQIDFIWSTTPTHTNIQALYMRTGSRAESLFEEGYYVDISNISLALKV